MGVTVVRRLALLIALVLSAEMATPRANAQPAAKVVRVGFLGAVPPAVFDGFLLAMRDLGCQEGRNLVLTTRRGTPCHHHA
jgi:hypothetical protein